MPASSQNRPYSPACERNREPILRVLKRYFPESGRILEIGSGTGQHAVYFAGATPGWIWQPSDRRDNHVGIRAWIANAALDNVSPPLELDVSRHPWPVRDVEAVFSGNTAHIMHWFEACAMIAGVGQLLKSGGVFCLYGPFHYGGEHTSDSNAAFDRQLRSQDPGMGIRDAHKVAQRAQHAGMDLIDDVAMPANNRTLVFQKDYNSTQLL